MEPSDGNVEDNHVDKETDEATSPAQTSSTVSLADASNRSSDDETLVDGTKAETIEWTDILLSPDKEQGQPSVVVAADDKGEDHNNRAHALARKLAQNESECKPTNYTTPVSGSESDDTDLEDHIGDNYPSKHASTPEASRWDSGSLRSHWSSDSDSIEEENPRLSQYERWQQDLLHTESLDTLSRDVGKTRLDLIAEEPEEQQDSDPAVVVPQIVVSEYASPTSLEVNVDVEDIAETRVLAAPESEVKIARVESKQPFPRQNPKQYRPQARPPIFKSYLEIAGGIDITVAAEVKTLANSLPATVVRNIGREKSPHPKPSPSPRISAGPQRSEPLDASTLETVLENCIRYTSNLLSGGRNKRALAQSQEVARLMESVLLDNVGPLRVGEGKRSLSDLIDRSAWRN